MSSRRTLIILSLVALVLGVIVVMGGDKKRRRADSPRVVPEYRVGQVARLLLERRGRAPLELTSAAAGEPLVLVKPVRAPVDANAIDGLLGTIETLSHARRVRGRRIDRPRLTITIVMRDGTTVQLALGDLVQATQQTWLTKKGNKDAYLIPAYAARALDRGVDDIRRRSVFDTVADVVTGVELNVGVTSLVLSGQPLLLHLDGGGTARIRPRAITGLLGRLESARLERFDASTAKPTPGTYTLRIIGSAGTEQLVHVGPCPGRSAWWLVDTAAGRGCVDPAPFIQLQRLSKRPLELIDHSLVMAGHKTVGLAVSHRSKTFEFRRRGATWFGKDGRAASTSAVDAWLGSFNRLSRPKHVRALAGTREVARVVLNYDGGDKDVVRIVSDKQARLFARRNDEPLFFELVADAAKLFVGVGTQLRDRQLVSAQALGLNRARALRGGVVVEDVVRGATHGDWRASAPKRAKALVAAIDKLRHAAAQLRAQRFSAMPMATVRRRVELYFDKTPAEPATTVVIDVGPATNNGCLARRAKQPDVFELSNADCAALLGPWTRP